MYPTLMIVPNLVEVERDLRNRGFRICRIDSVSEARDVVRGLKGIRLTTPVVLSDLSQLRVQATLLKFVEETSLMVILLASQDNISSVMLSRMKRVVKETVMIEPRQDDPGYLGKILTEGEDKITVKEIVENCPSASEFLWTYKRARIPAKQKALELILGKEG